MAGVYFLSGSQALRYMKENFYRSVTQHYAKEVSQRKTR